MYRICVVGAGITGVTIAKMLEPHADITVIDKSRGVGGRISTRRHDEYSFDHGAQFFTVRDERFKNFIQPLIDQGIIEPWLARFVEISNKEMSIERTWNKEYKHFVGVPGMNQIVKHLAKDRNIKLNTEIKKTPE